MSRDDTLEEAARTITPILKRAGLVDYEAEDSAWEVAHAALAVFEEANTPPGPAYIDIMPPSPETSKRWWSMYCRECGIEEGMADSSDDERLIAQRDEHNRSVHSPANTPTDDEQEVLGRALWDALRAKINRPPNPGMVEHLRDAVLAAGFHRTVKGEPTVEEWSARAQAAREKAIAKGYTPEHDAEHGIRHLLNWAIDYARRGRAEDASGLILSAIALLDDEQPSEPSEVAVSAAGEVLYGISWGTDLADPDLVRAALRAAAETERAER